MLSLSIVPPLWGSRGGAAESVGGMKERSPRPGLSPFLALPRQERGKGLPLERRYPPIARNLTFAFFILPPLWGKCLGERSEPRRWGGAHTPGSPPPPGLPRVSPP